MVSEYFKPKRKEQARSKATSVAELQQIEVYIQSHRQAKGLNEQKSTDSLKYRLRLEGKQPFKQPKYSL